MEMRQFQFGSARSTSTPTKIAIIVFGLIFFLPIFALLLVAGAVASVVFGILLIITTISRKIKTVAKRKDSSGRKNVRVKR